MVRAEALTVSDRTRLRRKRERGSHDRALVDSILDEGLVCHVGYCDDDGPVVLPTAYGRVGDVLYLHGATGNHMLRSLSDGRPACVTVTLLDGVVLSRAAMHHSMNFRSVMLFGRARAVDEPSEKTAAVTAVVEHVVPGRSSDARPPSADELRATSVLAFPIDEGSAKVRSGGPVEDPEDLALAVWAGQLPLTLAAGDPVPDAELAPDTALPGYLSRGRFAPPAPDGSGRPGR